MLAIILSSVELNADSKNKFEAIYYRYKSALFYKALSIVGSEKDAEDILQESFIKIAKNMGAIDDIKSKETISFLMVITKNTAYDYIRRTSKITELPLTDAENYIDDGALDNLVSSIEYKQVVAVIAEIPSPYNEVLYFHYVKDYSVKKTAVILSRKPATVKMQLVRGKKMLLDKLSEVGYE